MGWQPLSDLKLPGDWFSPLTRFRECVSRYDTVPGELKSSPTGLAYLFDMVEAVGRCRRTRTLVPPAEDGTLLPHLCWQIIPTYVAACRDVEVNGVHGLVAMVEDQRFPVVAVASQSPSWPALVGGGVDVDAATADAVIDATAILVVQRYLTLWYAHAALEEGVAAATARGQDTDGRLALTWQEGRDAFRDVEAALRAEGDLLVPAARTRLLENHRMYFQPGSPVPWLLDGTLTRLADRVEESIDELRDRLFADPGKPPEPEPPGDA